MNLRSVRGRDDPEINFIPLIDVLLVILIFLMVTTTYQRVAELQITLPEAEAEQLKQRPKEINVGIGGDDDRGRTRRRATVTAAHDAWMPPPLGQRARQRGHERRLAAAAHRDVADDNHRHRQLVYAQQPRAIKRAAHEGNGAERDSQRHERCRQRGEVWRVPGSDEAGRKRHVTHSTSLDRRPVSK